MCDEMRKATERRMMSENYQKFTRYFKGHGLDIGCGNDKMRGWSETESITGYDQMFGSGDAQYLPEFENDRFDFVVSSHCLEHMKDPREALRNWIRVVKPGGFLVVTIPEWEMYEHRHWPSRYNGDHKTAWTMDAHRVSDGAHVVYLPSFLEEFVERGLISGFWMRRCIEGFDQSLPDTVDQTGGPAECALEFIVRKMH